MADQLKEITQSMKYKAPELGDNVLKFGKFVRICSTRGCARPVSVSRICVTTGRVEYSCPVHGKRNRANMDWLDVTGSTMIEFRKVGLNESPT